MNVVKRRQSNDKSNGVRSDRGEKETPVANAFLKKVFATGDDLRLVVPTVSPNAITSPVRRHLVHCLYRKSAKQYSQGEKNLVQAFLARHLIHQIHQRSHANPGWAN